MTTLDITLIFVGVVLLLVAAGCSVAALRAESRLEALAGAPAFSASDIAAILRRNGPTAQPCEITGVVECDASLSGPLSGQACVAYSHTLTWEEWGPPAQYGRGYSTEMVKRNGGTEFDDRRAPLLWVRDATGRVLVDPTNAEIELLPIDERYDVTSMSVGGGERREWHEEKGLPLGQQVYVIGYLGERRGEPVIGRHPRDPSKKFLISHRSKQDLAGATRASSTIYYLAAGVSSILGVLLIAWRLLLLRGGT